MMDRRDLLGRLTRLSGGAALYSLIPPILADRISKIPDSSTTQSTRDASAIQSLEDCFDMPPSKNPGPFGVINVSDEFYIKGLPPNSRNGKFTNAYLMQGGRLEDITNNYVHDEIYFGNVQKPKPGAYIVLTSEPVPSDLPQAFNYIEAIKKGDVPGIVLNALEEYESAKVWADANKILVDQRVKSDSQRLLNAAQYISANPENSQRFLHNSYATAEFLGKIAIYIKKFYINEKPSEITPEVREATQRIKDVISNKVIQAAADKNRYSLECLSKTIAPYLR